MLKKLLGIAVLILVGLNIYYSFTDITIDNKPVINPDNKPVVIKTVSREDAVSSIEHQKIKEYIEKLASREFNGRGSGYEGNTIAANYICEYLNQINVPYLKQKFKVNRGSGETENIIGYIIPTKLESDKIIVIGAHFDHLGGSGSAFYPGADDNASGTAGLMAITKALSLYKDSLKHTVLLHFYSGEELGLIGSSYYCNNPLFPLNKPSINNHIAMINLDMIGFLKKYEDNNYHTIDYSQKNTLTDFTGYVESQSIKNIVAKLSDRYTFAKNISSYKPSGSDHAPFYRKGIPVVFLHTGTHPYYHKVTDTPDRLNYKGIAEIAKLATEIAIEIDTNYSDGINTASSK